MKKYIVYYHYFSDGGAWVVFAKNKNEAIEKAQKLYDWEIIKEFLKVYDIDEIKEDKEL
jgi:hypothetical protein